MIRGLLDLNFAFVFSLDSFLTFFYPLVLVSYLPERNLV